MPSDEPDRRKPTDDDAPLLPHEGAYCPPAPTKLPGLPRSPRRYLKSPTLAALLSLLVAGLGHLYVGDIPMGVMLLFLWCCLGLLESTISGTDMRSSLPVMFGKGGGACSQVALSLLAAADAYRRAVRVNQRGTV